VYFSTIGTNRVVISRDFFDVSFLDKVKIFYVLWQICVLSSLDFPEPVASSLFRRVRSSLNQVFDFSSLWFSSAPIFLSHTSDTCGCPKRLKKVCLVSARYLESRVSILGLLICGWNIPESLDFDTIWNRAL
jgi:hypothetical protein